MKVALYFGSFNPIHIGHLAIANYIATHQPCDQVWFVVSPHNPHKEKSSLLADYHRLNLVKTAIDDNPKFRASDIEFGLDQPSYTVKTLAYLREKYPNNTFTLIMGEDNLRSLHRWYNYEAILNNHEIFVYPRVVLDSESKNLVNVEIINHPSIKFCSDLPIMSISSSYIRKEISNGISPKYLLTPEVLKYIDEMGFYR